MLSPLFRKPQRISVTVSYRLYTELVERSQREGRSVSNLASFLLEEGIRKLEVELTGANDQWAA